MASSLGPSKSHTATGLGEFPSASMGFHFTITFPLPSQLWQIEHRHLNTCHFFHISLNGKETFLKSRSFYLVLLFEPHNHTMWSCVCHHCNIELPHKTQRKGTRACKRSYLLGTLLSSPTLMKWYFDFVKVCPKMSLGNETNSVSLSTSSYVQRHCPSFSSKGGQWPTSG